MAHHDRTVCANCASPVDDTSQVTCPHCLEGLSVKRFASQEGVEAYKEDRRAHGAPVDDPHPSSGRPVLAIVLGFFGLVMLIAAGGLVLSGFFSGSRAELTTAIVQSLVPLGIGAGLFQVARQYGGWDR